jgi:hypothetical protein
MISQSYVVERGLGCIEKICTKKREKMGAKLPEVCERKQ